MFETMKMRSISKAIGLVLLLVLAVPPAFCMDCCCSDSSQAAKQNSEHDCCAKIVMPWYEEVAHTPFFVWDPRCGKKGERRQALVQPSIDLAPTILDFYGL